MDAMTLRTDVDRQVQELSSALRAVHGRLLAETQMGFEKVYGRVEGAGALLQLAIHDPFFAWLRPLAQKMTELDELEVVTGPGLVQIKADLARLFDEPSDFRTTYLDVLQTAPGVVLAHAALRRLVQPSPQLGAAA
jgi:hypothetical protein